MKIFIPILFLIYSLSAMAEFQGKTIRYSTTYDSFDRVIYSHYGYNEGFYSESFCNGYRTCYHPSMRTERVYIEERIVERSYVDSYKAETRITIYSDASYSRPYVTYHTHNGRIVNRSYHHNHSYYGWHHGHGSHYCDDYYYGDYYHYHTHYYYEIDWSTPEGKIITGLHMLATAASLASDCSDIDDSDAKAACMGLAFASAFSGSASSAAGIDQAIQESKLYKALEKDAKDNGEKDLDVE